MAINWEYWQRTTKATVADRGEWWGLLDENWEPIGTISPIDPHDSDLRLTPPELEASFDGQVQGRVSQVVDELVAEDLGVFDERGYFLAKNDLARSVCVQRGGERSRQAFFLPYTDGKGRDAPESLTVAGTGLLSLLEAWPAPSIPMQWTGDFQLRSGDAGASYKTPREYSLLEMTTRVDGYTVFGPAERTIRVLVQDCLDAVNTHMGWSGRPHMVVDFASTGRVSPEVLIPVQDDPVLPTVENAARVAGVNISADLWWPGDEAVLVRTSKPGSKLRTGWKSWPHPIVVLRVEQMEGE